MSSTTEPKLDMPGDPQVIIDIDRNGDVILVCGKGNETKTVRVHSNILTMSSKVFSAMLEPNRFKEGTTLAAEATVRLPLPDDDGGVMELMCKVLHNQHQALDTPSPVELLDLALLADKYDCKGMMSYQAYFWIKELLNQKDDATDEGVLVAAAYNFQQESAFAAAVGDFVLNHKGVIEFGELAAELDSMDELCVVLHDMQARAFDTVEAAILEYIHTLGQRDDCHETRCKETSTHYCIAGLGRKGLVNKFTAVFCSVAYVLEQVEGLQIHPAAYQCLRNCPACEPYDYDSDLASLMVKLKRRVKAAGTSLLENVPCLHCGRTGKWSLVPCEHKVQRELRQQVKRRRLK